MRAAAYRSDRAAQRMSDDGSWPSRNILNPGGLVEIYGRVRANDAASGYHRKAG